MEKKWNEEVVRLAKDLRDLREAERHEGVRSMINVFYKWVEEYFAGENYENSTILNYSIQPRNTIKITFLGENLLISFDGFAERVIVKCVKSNREEDFVYYYSTETLKSEDHQILSSKHLFEIIDTFTKNTINNYSKDHKYLA